MTNNDLRKQRELDGLIMGFPLDHLLDQETEINKPYDRRPGIILPSQEAPGTGNIIICGPPGSGKSTLGLQIAAACAKIEENHSVSAFLSLETTIEEIRAKAKAFGWMKRWEGEEEIGEDLLLEAMHLGDVDEFSTPDAQADNLLAILTRPEGCLAADPKDNKKSDSPSGNHLKKKIEPHVLLPLFTPRDLEGAIGEADIIFQRRYKQLEVLLMAAQKLEERRAVRVALIHLAKIIFNLMSAGSDASEEKAYKDEMRLAMKLKAQSERLILLAKGEVGVLDKIAAKTRPSMMQAGFDLISKVADLAKSNADLGSKDSMDLNIELACSAWSLAERYIQKQKDTEEQKARQQIWERDHKRYDELVHAALKAVGARSILPLVVIDSLNMFSTSPLNRNQIHQLFSLFKRYRRIGVFTVETNEETQFDSTIADVAIKLSIAEDNGYAVRYIEIEKSRYSQNVRGLHPFKTISFENQLTPPLPGRSPRRRKNKGKEPARCGVVIFPSLHHVVLKTDISQNQVKDIAKDPDRKKDDSKTPFHECFNIKGFKSVLPESLMRAKKVYLHRKGQNPETAFLRGRVVMIEGERGTFKTSIALNFLAAGLADENGETTMLIRLSDTPLIEEHRDSQLHEGDSETGRRLITSEELIRKNFSWKELKLAHEPKDPTGSSLDWQNIAPVGKVQLRKLYWERPNKERSILFELDFKGGHVLPEEFVQFVCDVLIRMDAPQHPENKIKRVVLDDVSQIGVSYPFLRKSLTSGTIFLPTFAHLMRNYGVDLVMVGSRTGVPEADEIVTKAGTLADAVISCRFVDVFGKRCVAVSGGVNTETERGPALPVIRRGKTKDGKECLELDTKYLEGLVGVETANAHRPGLILHLFEGDETIHHAYNREMEAMLRAGLARPGQLGASNTVEPNIGSEMETVDVSVQPFNSHLSEAIHDSLSLLVKKPFNRTVLCTVDEFSGKSQSKDKLFIEHKLGQKRADDGEEVTLGEEGGEKDTLKMDDLPEFEGLTKKIHKLEKYIHDFHNEKQRLEKQFARLKRGGNGNRKNVSAALKELNKLNEKLLADVLIRLKRRDLPSIEELEALCEGSGDLKEISNELNGLCHLKYVWPYYRNVLLLAYRKDWIRFSAKPGSWRKINDKIETRKTRSKTPSLPINARFWFDLTAGETLSCILMDVLSSADHDIINKLNRIAKPRDIGNEFTHSKNLKSFEPEINALKALLGMGFSSAVDMAQQMLAQRTANMTIGIVQSPSVRFDASAREMLDYKDIDKYQESVAYVRSGRFMLPPDAGVYVCWYSQLRELIAREPRLATEMRVCPLPGGGFKGDWYIGILNGSVSADLGREVIKKLCRQEEEYKRFSRSIGLPVSKKFKEAEEGMFFAWQRGSHVPLESIFSIHKKANSRSDIEEYTKIRSTLSTLTWQLIAQPGYVPLDAERFLEKLYNQVRILKAK